MERVVEQALIAAQVLHCKRPGTARAPHTARVHGAPSQDRAPSRQLEDNVGRFLIGFLVAIVIVLFIVVQCAQALF